MDKKFEKQEKYFLWKIKDKEREVKFAKQEEIILKEQYERLLEKDFELDCMKTGNIVVKLRELGFGKCKICFETKYINNVLLPCKHNGLCIDCAKNIY